MLAKTFTFTDYNGVKRTETHYFNLTKAEIIELEYSTSGGLVELLKRISESEDNTKMVPFIKTFIKKCYGAKSPDGRQLVKNEETWDSFAQTDMYSDLFMEMVTDPKAAYEFILGVMPQGLDKTKLAESIKEYATENSIPVVEIPDGVMSAEVK